MKIIFCSVFLFKGQIYHKCGCAALCDSDRADGGQLKPLGDGSCPGGHSPRGESGGGRNANEPRQADNIWRGGNRAGRRRCGVCGSWHPRGNSQDETATPRRTDGGESWLRNKHWRQVRGLELKPYQGVLGNVMMFTLQGIAFMFLFHLMGIKSRY